MSDTNNQEIISNRGRLKIFLGAVPGVGKTYKMLSEAHRRLSRGEEIVLGLVETHGRVATAELLEGLEQVPLKRIEYRGAMFNELDTAGVLSRKPKWIIIDELAHTNVPGTVHAKRWQSIEEIRNAGINVVTTLNVQHIESLNDAVYEITGIRVRETVPDSIVDNADEIELVDLSTEAIINRLKRGDIYKEEKILQALSNFFRKENIVALRELALRRTADDVDEMLQVYLEAQHLKPIKAAHEHVVVSITPRPSAIRLIRKGYRIAHRMQANFDCIYVRIPGTSLTAKEEAALNEAKALARNLGGNCVELPGESVADEIIKYINESGCTLLVMGQSLRGRWEEILKGSIINKIMRHTKNVDITVVAECTDKECEK
jgi:two-component system, OmpR family, sensor histidine kinase KdpD